MISSGTYAFQPTIGDMVLQAYRRVGVNRPSVDREKLTDAFNELNALFSDWSNKGPNLWAVDTVQVPILAGVATYALSPSIIDILDATIIDLAGRDRVLTGMSRSDYAAYPEKTRQGQPTSFWFDRLVSPTITLWPVPSQASTLTLYRFRQTQDANLAGGQVAEVPYRWYDAVIWGLAERLAFIYAMDKLPAIAPKAQAVYAAAAAEDTEDANLVLRPDLSAYF